MKVGDIIDNRYLLKEFLGEGVSGMVFLADDRQKGERVALKALKDNIADEEYLGRFRSEFENIASISHPGMVRVFEMGEGYFTMEYLAGRLLDTSEKRSAAETMRIVAEICRALNFIHRNGLIHGDLKPAHIMMPPEGSDSGIKLIDFGLARAMASAVTLTREDIEIEGTVEYMPPEHIKGLGKDARSDLYSLGVILYEMLTGRLPFAGKDFLSIALGHLNEPVVPPTKIEHAVPAPLEALTLRLLNKDPEKRYQSAEEVGRRLMEMLGDKEARDSEVMKGRQFLFSPAFSGRDKDMETVETFYRRALGGSGNCVLIHGEAGLGKTRLLREFRAAHLLDDVIFLSSSASASPGVYNRYYADIVSQALEVMSRFGEKLRDEKLWEWSIGLTRLAPATSERWFMDHLEQIVMTEPGQMLRNVGDALVTLTQHRPVAVLIDNLHLADRFGAELFYRLVRLAQDKRIFILGSYRDMPGGRETPFSRAAEGLKRGVGFAEQRLKPLSRKELDHLVASMMSHSSVARDMSAEIANVTGGNPLFAEEMVRAFADQNIIVKVGSQWQLDREKLDRYDMPESLGEIVMERATRVGPQHNEVLAVAAVIGAGIDYATLQALTGKPHIDMYYILGDIVSQGILAEADRGAAAAPPHSRVYNFTSESVREHFYKTLDEKRRRKYHAQIARMIETAHPDAMDTVLDSLVYHYTGSGDDAKLLRCLLRSGALAEREGAYERANDFRRRALDLLGADSRDPVMVVVLSDMARADLLMGDMESAEDCLERVIKLFPRDCPHSDVLNLTLGQMHLIRGELESAVENFRHVADGRDAASIDDAALLFCLGTHALANDLHDKAADFFNRALAVAARNNDETVSVRANAMHSALMLRQSKIAEAVNRLSAALSGAERLDNPGLKIEVLAGLVEAHLRAGKVERARACLLQAEENAPQNADLLATVALRLAQARYNLETGSLDEAAESAESGMSIARQAKYRSGALDAQALLGLIAIKRDDLRHGIEMCQRALSTARALNSKYRMAGIACTMGEAYMARGEYDTALEFLGHSRRIYEKLKLEGELSRIFFLLGELYYRRRDLFSARQFLNRTLENATLQDDWLLMGESHRVLAKVFLEEDERESAMTNFQRAVELLEKHGNPIFLARVCQDYALFLSESERPETQKEGLALMERALKLFAKAGAGLLARKADVMVKKFRRRYRDRSLAQRDAIPFDGISRLREEAGQKFHELLREAEIKMNTDGFSDKVLEEVRANILQARSELFGQIDNLSQQNQRLQQDIDFLMEEKNNLSLLQEISRTINSELDLNRLISKVLDMVIEVLQAERGFLILRNKDGKLTIRTARNIDKDAVSKPEFKLSFSIAKRVVKTGEVILTSNAQEDARFKDKISVLDLKLKSVLCVPFKFKDKILGAVYVDNRFVSGLFSEKDLDLLTAFSNQAAIALENARLYEENLEKQRETEQLNRKLRQQVDTQRDELDKTRSVLEDSQKQLALKYDYSNIKGKSRAMQEVFHLLDRVIDSRVTVLVQGASGTGKELVARAIHYNGPLKDKPFAAENCAALPESLLESELFGYVKGAFTGADRDKKGLFEIANGGTLFLDEIGEMSENLQAKLLRVLQDGMIRPVGGKEYKKVSVRLISATNKDLRKLMEKGQFREDLYYRINVVTISLPTLRERREDIPILVDFFLDKAARAAGQPRREITPEVMTLLERYSWPGNVRELENEIARIFALSSGTVLGKESLSPNILMLQHAPQPQEVDFGRVRVRSLKELERDAINGALRSTGGNKVEAARLLEIDRTTLYNKMKKYGILE